MKIEVDKAEADFLRDALEGVMKILEHEISKGADFGDDDWHRIDVARSVLKQKKGD